VAKIFVIDDDDQLLRMVGLMLERGGHAVSLINNPRAGLEQLQADKPDLLVLDVMMPGMSGHELTRQIRATSGLEELPILILTARSQDIDKSTALESGADGYLSKPVTSHELIEQVDKLLAQTLLSSKQEETEPGIVLALYGLRGGVGQTTLAVNLALALRRVSKQEVCLVDLSPNVGQTAFHLQLKSQHSWGNLLTHNALDWTILRDALMIHSSGLRLLAAPTIPQSPMALSAATVSRILSILRERLLFTVLDLPPVLSPAFTAALAATDIGLQVVTPEAVAVRTAVQTNRALAKLDVKPRQQSFVLNQVSVTAQLPIATVERVLNGRIPFQIEYDPYQARALAQGTPLVMAAADSPLAVVVKRMADVVWKRMSAKMSQN